jgi:hypothetical protein
MKTTGMPLRCSPDKRGKEVLPLSDCIADLLITRSAVLGLEASDVSS